MNQLTIIDAIRRSSRQPAEQQGAVERINASCGGVPKHAIGTAEIGWRGIAGDVQKTRVHHGRP